MKRDEENSVKTFCSSKARKPANVTLHAAPVHYFEMHVKYPKTYRRIYINCPFNQIPFHMAHTTSNPKIHEGRNLKRFRELLGLKQDSLAFELGEDWNQQKVSLLEQREKIDSDILEQVSAILKIPAEAIRNFDEDQALNVISNTFHDGAFFGSSQITYNSNPIAEIRKLHEEKMELYERMLKEKDEMMGRLERLMEGK
jgi:transcriptional regulator with XRE-family HTH domain